MNTDLLQQIEQQLIGLEKRMLLETGKRKLLFEDIHLQQRPAAIIYPQSSWKLK